MKKLIFAVLMISAVLPIACHPLANVTGPVSNPIPSATPTATVPTSTPLFTATPSPTATPSSTPTNTATPSAPIPTSATALTYTGQWGSTGSGNGQLETSSTGVVTDSLGNVYIADRNNYRIEKFDSAGNYLGQWGTPGS